MELPGGQSLNPSQKAYNPTFLPTALCSADADWESLCPKLLLSQLIYIRPSDGVSAQSVFGELSFSPNTRSHTTSVTLLRHPALSLVCLLAHSLTHSLVHLLAHTLQLMLAPSLASLCHQMSHAI